MDCRFETDVGGPAHERGHILIVIFAPVTTRTTLLATIWLYSSDELMEKSSGFVTKKIANARNDINFDSPYDASNNPVNRNVMFGG